MQLGAALALLYTNIFVVVFVEAFHLVGGGSTLIDRLVFCLRITGEWLSVLLACQMR